MLLLLLSKQHGRVCAIPNLSITKSTKPHTQNKKSTQALITGNVTTKPTQL